MGVDFDALDVSRVPVVRVPRPCPPNNQPRAATLQANDQPRAATATVAATANDLGLEYMTPDGVGVPGIVSTDGGNTPACRARTETLAELQPTPSTKAAPDKKKKKKKKRQQQRSIVGKFQISWVFGSITRASAEQLLTEHGMADGLFLVRVKGAAGQYAISMAVAGRFEHHVLAKSAGGPGYTLNNKPMSTNHTSLGRIVQHLSANKESMTCPLVDAIKNPFEGKASVKL